MTEDFRERLNIKLRYLNRPDCECVSDLMEFHFFQSVSFQKTGEELPISTRLCRLCFAGQEVVVRVIRVELLIMFIRRDGTGIVLAEVFVLGGPM